MELATTMAVLKKHWELRANKVFPVTFTYMGCPMCLFTDYQTKKEYGQVYFADMRCKYCLVPQAIGVPCQDLNLDLIRNNPKIALGIIYVLEERLKELGLL